jgi:hypothetical protein
MKGLKSLILLCKGYIQSGWVSKLFKSIQDSSSFIELDISFGGFKYETSDDITGILESVSDLYLLEKLRILTFKILS